MNHILHKNIARETRFEPGVGKASFFDSQLLISWAYTRLLSSFKLTIAKEYNIE